MYIMSLCGALFVMHALARVVHFELATNKVAFPLQVVTQLSKLWLCNYAFISRFN